MAVEHELRCLCLEFHECGDDNGGNVGILTRLDQGDAGPGSEVSSCGFR